MRIQLDEDSVREIKRLEKDVFAKIDDFFKERHYEKDNVNEIVFYGLEGGRSSVSDPSSTSVGYLLKLNKKYILLECGIDFKKIPLNILKSIDWLLVSHNHPDHQTGIRTFVEVMTNGGYRKKGVIISNPTVKEYLGEYHANAVEKHHTLKEGEEIRLGDFEIRTTPCIHPETGTVDETMGFRIKTRLYNKDFVLSYTSDTSLFKDGKINKELINSHKGANILLINFCLPYYSMEIPRVARILKKHLGIIGAYTLAKEVKPDMVFLTHPCRISCDQPVKEKSLEILRKLLDMPVLFEENGMRLVINEDNYTVFDSSSRIIERIPRIL